MKISPSNVLVYDGACGICSNSVNYLLKNTNDNLLQAIPFQSERGRKILTGAGLDSEKVESLVYFDEKGIHRKSDAILSVTKKMRGLFPYLNYLRFVPRFLRDGVYDLVARNRHKFNRLFSDCEVPFPDTDKQNLK